MSVLNPIRILGIVLVFLVALVSPSCGGTFQGTKTEVTINPTAPSSVVVNVDGDDVCRVTAKEATSIVVKCDPNFVPWYAEPARSPTCVPDPCVPNARTVFLPTGATVCLPIGK